MIGNFKQVKKELDSIGCGFVLQNGHKLLYTCPESYIKKKNLRAHKRSLDELENNPMLCIIQKKRKSVEKKC